MNLPFIDCINYFLIDIYTKNMCFMINNNKYIFLIFVVNVVADNIPVTLNDVVVGILRVGLNVKPLNLTNSLIFLNP